MSGEFSACHGELCLELGTTTQEEVSLSLNCGLQLFQVLLPD